MESRNVAAAALTTGVVTMWGAPPVEGAFIEPTVRVDLTGEYELQSQVNDAILLICSFGYDGSETRPNVDFLDLGSLNGQGGFSYSGTLDVALPVNYNWATKIGVAILGTHEADTGDGVTIGTAPYYAAHILQQPASDQILSEEFFEGSNDPDFTQLSIHNAIAAGDKAELERLFFQTFPRTSILPYKTAQVWFTEEDLGRGVIEGTDLDLTLLNFSEASMNGTAVFDMSISLIPEPATLALCLGLAPLCVGRRGRTRLDKPHNGGTNHGKP